MPNAAVILPQAAMPARLDLAGGATSSARLLIDAGEDACGGGGWFAALLRYLRGLAGARAGGQAGAPAAVCIDDLNGRTIFVSDDARSTIDLVLPAGTYHVSIQQGHRRRRYTVALERGATFHLRPLAMQRA